MTGMPHFSCCVPVRYAGPFYFLMDTFCLRLFRFIFCSLIFFVKNKCRILSNVFLASFEMSISVFPLLT